MADNKTHTGSRDDLAVDASRCLKMRYSESCCRRCVDICPHTAVSLDGFLVIDPNHCRGCLLCTAVCPAGALEQSSDFSNILVQLSRVPEPVIGCIRTKESSNAAMSCLGGLSAEHLLALCHTLSGKLTINMTVCGDCPNCAMVPQLHKRIEVLSEEGLLEGSCRIVPAESVQNINFHDESIGRRSFFSSFRKSLFQSAAVILSANDELIERRSEYAEKRVPVRRTLLNMIRISCSPELEVRMQKRFDTCITFDESCTKCHGCVSVCPTGSLQTEQVDTPPVFDQSLCSGCGLCSEFCLDSAVMISTG